jgi:MFS family permease
LYRSITDGDCISFRLDQPAKARRHGNLSRVVAGRFRFLPACVRTQGKEFQTDLSNVTLAILLTLAMRPVGAFIFGRAADHWGRRPTLMINILLYSILEFASGFAPSLTVLIVRVRYMA